MSTKMNSMIFHVTLVDHQWIPEIKISFRKIMGNVCRSKIVYNDWLIHKLQTNRAPMDQPY